MLTHARIKNISYSKQIQYLLEQKDCKEKSTSKNVIFFTEWHFEQFVNRMNESYEVILKLSYGIKCMYKMQILLF